MKFKRYLYQTPIYISIGLATRSRSKQFKKILNDWLEKFRLKLIYERSLIESDDSVSQLKNLSFKFKFVIIEKKKKKKIFKHAT